MSSDPQQPEVTLADQQGPVPPTDESVPAGVDSVQEVEGLDPNGAVNVVSHGSPSDSASASNTDQVQIIEVLQMELDTLKQKYEQQTQQFEANKIQAVRIAADFDNFRKRTQREKEELEYLVKRNTITEVLTVVDNFERARAQIKPETDGEMNIHKSYQGVYKNLVDGLKRLGVSAMRPEGEAFDPNLHEAVFREQTAEYPEDTVIEQLQRGYLLNERVLRHAMVKVAAPPDPAISDAASPSDETDAPPSGD